MPIMVLQQPRFATMMNNLISNPLFARAQEMAKGRSNEELEQIAKNICKEKGIDYEMAKQQFKGFMPFR